MEDRFKFRVWCKNRNEWERDDVLMGVEGNAYFVERIKFEPYNPKYSLQPVNLENHIIEQCTGLKDKNGKLIFENDFVRMCGFADVYIIKWVQESCQFISQYTKNSNIIKHWYDIKDFEIIGNIHENSDLLK